MKKDIYSIADIKSILNKVLKDTKVKRAVLFGSYAKNVPTKESDIDIMIDCEGKVKGLEFYKILDDISQSFDKDKKKKKKIEIEEDSPIEGEIKRTGVVVYKKQ